MHEGCKNNHFFCNKRLISSSVNQWVLFKKSISGPDVALIEGNQVICLNFSTCTALRLACRRSWKIALIFQDCAVYMASAHAATWVPSRTGDFCSEMLLRQLVCLAVTAAWPWQSGAKEHSSAQISWRLLLMKWQLADLVVDVSRRALIHDGPEEKRETLWWNCTLSICILLTALKSETEAARSSTRHTSFPHKACTLHLYCSIMTTLISKSRCHVPTPHFVSSKKQHDANRTVSGFRNNHVLVHVILT